MFKKIKKIYLISSKKKSLLLRKMAESIPKNYFFKQIDPNALLFDVTGSEIKVIHKNEILDFKHSYTFFTNRTRNICLNSLLVLVLDKLKKKHSAKLYKYIKQTEDKHHQVINLFLNKIPVPKTIITSEFGIKKNKDYLNKKFKKEFVLKVSGSRGDFVWKLKKLEDIFSKLNTLSSNKKEIITIQEVIQEAEYDIRALYFKNKCIASMKREGEGFLNNHSKGAKVSKYNLSKAEKKVCQKASKVSELDFLGIDFMNTKKGPVILELQNSPYMRGIRGTDENLNIGKNIVNEILKINL